jgi:ubiquinone/menaquinone biosynthesis C-methylase UbiE
VLDVGCGDGSVSFEVAKRLNRGEVIGLDVDPVTIKSTMETKEAARVKNADFRVMSASGLVDVADKSCDVVLLIDVMEHVVDDRSVAREVSRVLRPGGALVVSVPTPNYPRVFGREFHEAVGHVREGYSIERLEELLAEQQMHVEKHAYYTYPPSALVCLLYYRWLRKVRYVSVLGSPLLNLFSYLDYVWPIRRGAWACSISLVARREPN